MPEESGIENPVSRYASNVRTLLTWSALNFSASLGNLGSVIREFYFFLLILYFTIKQAIANAIVIYGVLRI